VTYNNFDWVLNPFVVAKTDLTGREEEFGELSSDRTLVWIKKLLHLFGWSVVDEYALLSKRQLKFYYLLRLPTIYMCEAAFSALITMKTKYRSRLAIESWLTGLLVTNCSENWSIVQ